MGLVEGIVIFVIAALVIIWLFIISTNQPIYDYMDNVGNRQVRNKIELKINPLRMENAYRSNVIPIIPQDASRRIGKGKKALNSLRRINYNNNGVFNDLRGLPLASINAYSRYADDEVYDIISDTGSLIWESNFDPRNYMDCNTVNCPNSRDTRFNNDICLNCRPVH